jgi:ankyrin repeat protein
MKRIIFIITLVATIVPLFAMQNIQEELFNAVRQGDSEIIYKLCGENIVNMKDQRGSTLLIAACGSLEGQRNIQKREDMARIVSILLKRGADVNAQCKDGFSALHCASYEGYPDIVEMLLRRPIIINIRTFTGNATPLYLASAGLNAKHEYRVPRYKKVLKLLLDAGADPKLTTNIGRSVKDNILESEHLSIAEKTKFIESLKDNGLSE